jgi:hypothetical protein
MAGASALQRGLTDQYKDNWPYAWSYPPPNADQVLAEPAGGAVLAPANNTLTELLLFTVDDGYVFRLSHILLTIAGAAFADGTGQYQWTVDVNIPTAIGGGVLAPILPSGYVVPYFNAITAHRGSLDNGPWPIPGRLVFKPRDQIRVKVITQAPFGQGGSIFFLVSLVGWTWPALGRD